MTTVVDEPRSLREHSERTRRAALLNEPHVAPLAVFAESLRSSEVAVPNFDPLDGGIAAKMLFLFEKPGPQTDPEGGSGFISRNNNDSTAEAIFSFMNQAGIDRRLTVLWNVIPGWNKTIKIVRGELSEGLKVLPSLFALLSNLQVVVLVGAKAAKARDEIERMGLRVFVSAHPSPKVRAIYPEKWRSIPKAWECAYRAVGG